MAAPVANKIILPLDTGNTGKNVRTQTRVVGADTVHEHFFIPISKDSKLGLYKAHSGVLTIPTAAHNGTTTGHLWFFNPVGNTVKARLRTLVEAMQFTVLTAVDVSVPRSLYSLFTFTGTASGAAITPAKRDSVDAAATCTLRTASTGATVTLGASIRGLLPPINATASSATIQANMPPALSPPWDPDEEECLVLRAGEGVVLWAADAGTTANRRLLSDWEWEEFE
jgi:hypothetical protein